MKVSFIIPGIQPKQRPRFSRGHTYTPSATAEYELEIATLYAFKIGIMFEGPVKVSMRFMVKKGKTVKRDKPTVKPDIDNLIKSVLDGLNKVAWKDDAQVVELTARKEYYPEPCVEVTIEDDI